MPGGGGRMGVREYFRKRKGPKVVSITKVVNQTVVDREIDLIPKKEKRGKERALD